MIDWWQSLAPRERVLLGGAAVFLMLVGIWAGLLDPAWQRNQALRLQLEAKQALLAEVDTLASEAQTLRRSGRPAQSLPPGRSILEVTTASARAAGLQQAIRRMVPESGTRLRLQFDRVAFDRVIAWLEQLERQHGIAVQSISVEKLDTAGAVRTDFVLEAG